MKKLFIKTEAGEQGPFNLEELVAQNLSQDTQVRWEDVSDWVSLASISSNGDAVVSTATAASEAPQIAATPKPTPTAEVKTKKKTAGVSWIVLLAALGGIGFLVDQNMEKTKSGMPKVDLAADSTSLDQYLQENAATQNSNDSSMAADTAAPVNTETTNETNTEANTNDPTKNLPAKDKPTLTTKSKTTTNTAKQKADALIAKQKEQEAALQKQQEAQAAALAKARNYRNNWASYITIGKLNIKTNKDEGIEPFEIPVRNNTNALLEKVTLRVDYWKKDKKVVNSETVNVYNVLAGTILNGKAAGYKKGSTAKVIITSIISRKLNFCYPGSSYAPDDPFFCK